jgi:hypothetical protein
MKKRELLIILRTCQRVNMIHDNGGGRYIKVSKHELINVCMSSLVDSINRAADDYDINLVVLDDHSNPESITDFKTILSKCKAPTEFIPLDVTGNAESLAQVYELVEQRATDLWYHIEDDYLHFPDAIGDMIATANQFEINTGRMIAINPHDDVWRYTRNIYQSHILLGPFRHYRTVRHTTYSCLASRKIYDKYRQHFQDVVKLTREKADWVEDKTINLVWSKDDVLLFSPIPTLALHIMDESGRDPYIKIEELWDSIPELW